MTNNHENRREKIKRELDPKYKGIGNKEPSTTNLFGDQLQETIKTMGDSNVNLTNNQTTRKPILGKRRGSEVIPRHYNPDYNYNNNNKSNMSRFRNQSHKERSKQKVDPVSN